jgi:hypothetical protein
MSYLHYLFCLRIAESNTYCVVFLLCFSSSCGPCVASFSGLSFFDCPFGIIQHLFAGMVVAKSYIKLDKLKTLNI